MSESIFRYAGPPLLEVCRSSDAGYTAVWVEQAGGLPGVIIVVERADLAVLFVRQWRPSVASEVWQLPRGYSDDRDSGPLDSARRELYEETGILATHGELMGSLLVDPGITSSAPTVVRCWSADETISTGFASQLAENIDEVAWVTVDEVDAWIAKGVLTDALSLAALMLHRAGRPTG